MDEIDKSMPRRDSGHFRLLSCSAECDLEALALIAAPDVQFSLIPGAMRFERHDQVSRVINSSRSKADYPVADYNEPIAANAGGHQSRTGSGAVRIDSEDRDA
ncbi:hypothetical protein J2X08_004505 [Rhizobium rosettiformans]|nr:hypothetical protein [Rhizobium rosettiformans]MDR7066979.1 hypothetical protein [Rhizobium rosettiformans]